MKLIRLENVIFYFFGKFFVFCCHHFLMVPCSAFSYQGLYDSGWWLHQSWWYWRWKHLRWTLWWWKLWTEGKAGVASVSTISRVSHVCHAFENHVYNVCVYVWDCESVCVCACMHVCVYTCMCSCQYQYHCHQVFQGGDCIAYAVLLGFALTIILLVKISILGKNWQCQWVRLLFHLTFPSPPKKQQQTTTPNNNKQKQQQPKNWKRALHVMCLGCVCVCVLLLVLLVLDRVLLLLVEL